MKNTFLWRGTLAGASMFVLSTAYAGIPLWSFEALTSTNFPLDQTDIATVQYTVYNQSQRAKTLVLHSSLTPGVQQASPCILAPKSQQGACLLTLKISGNALPANGIHGGPVLCQANADGSPNPNQCYRPSPASALNIQKVNTPDLASLAVSSNALQLQTFGSAQTITITNLSTNITATNVNALFIGTPLAGAVTASTCTSIAPQGSCTMTFTPNRNAAPKSTFTIQGVNTSALTVQLNVQESFAYVTAATRNVVYRCSIQENSLIGSCVDSGAGAIFAQPQGIVLNKGKTSVYVVNFSGSVIKCNIDSNGNFTECDTTAATELNDPIGIALTNDGTKAYITNRGGPSSSVTLCQVDSDNNNLDFCESAGSIPDSYLPNGITLNKNNTLAYIAVPWLLGADSQLGKCNLLESGLLNDCVGTGPTGGYPFNGAHAIALNNNENLAYITNTGYGTPAAPGFVTLCKISNGLFSSCSGAGGVFSGPTGIALNINESFAYVSEYEGSNLNACSITPNVGFNTCTPYSIRDEAGDSVGLQFIALG